MNISLNTAIYHCLQFFRLKLSTIVGLLILVVISLQSTAQPYKHSGSGDIYQSLLKLKFLGSALYMAAHPDDENSRVIAKLALGDHATTAYLSMTRGDGGQNLIGPEIRDQLGLIRTYELLAARQIDGGEQFFTSANDFGFSKSADETFKTWSKEPVLKEVLHIFKTFQPDIIITRFPPTQQAGHGHHTASALLAEEAFTLHNLDPNAQPIKRLYTNTGRWWNATISESTPGVIAMDVGEINPLLGESFAEIAARSRTQHKSQGFGSSGSRGRQLEFFEYRKGDSAQNSLWSSINTSWSRLEGGTGIESKIDAIINQFNPLHPEQLVPSLIRLHHDISALADNVWRTRKLKEVEALILDCAGIFIEIKSDRYHLSLGDSPGATIEINNRSAIPVKIVGWSSENFDVDSTFNFVVSNNKPFQFRSKLRFTRDFLTSPYWLRTKGTAGRFAIPDANVGMSVSEALEVNLDLEIAGLRIRKRVPAIYRETDPVKGEVHRSLEVVPEVYLNPATQTLVFPNGRKQVLEVTAVSTRNSVVAGKLKPVLPSGWVAEPSEMPLVFQKPGIPQTVAFTLTPPEQTSSGLATFRFETEKGVSTTGLKELKYDHLPVITYQPPAQTKLVGIPLKGLPVSIGYISGAGDEIPDALRAIGYKVDILQPENLNPELLSNYKTVVLGVRLVNTDKSIKTYFNKLLTFVAEGGRLVVQYNTSTDLETDVFFPYPITLGRERITEENSGVEILLPQHPILQYPNQISKQDFEGWNQERGLYFPSSWAVEYETPLQMKDSGDPKPTNGSILYCRYGKGVYIYTGISFFRQLPEGIPGAFKLFENLINDNKEIKNRKKKML